MPKLFFNSMKVYLRLNIQLLLILRLSLSLSCPKVLSCILSFVHKLRNLFIRTWIIYIRLKLIYPIFHSLYLRNHALSPLPSSLINASNIRYKSTFTCTLTKRPALSSRSYSIKSSNIRTTTPCMYFRTNGTYTKQDEFFESGFFIGLFDGLEKIAYDWVVKYLIHLIILILGL